MNSYSLITIATLFFFSLIIELHLYPSNVLVKGDAICIKDSNVNSRSVVHSKGKDKGKCKPIEKYYLHMHTPVSNRECQKCHLGSTKPLKDCLSCHLEFNDRVQHGKNKSKKGKKLKRDCSTCHNSHGSHSPDYLIKEVSNICNQCHQKDRAKYQHFPVNKGSCDSCHTYHQPEIKTKGKKKIKGKKLIKRKIMPNSEYCYTCHNDLKIKSQKAVTVHEPFSQNCTKCHDTHQSNFPFQIKKDITKLCQSCHENNQTHGNNKNCLDCHNPHYSNHNNLLLMSDNNLCLSCHNKSLTSSSGQKLAGKKSIKILSPKSKIHKKIPTHYACSNCHSLHKGKNHYLHNKSYPEGLYQPYHKKAYDLCFTCHDSRAFAQKINFRYTNFHNNKINLHFIHVNHRKKGRSCHNCHDPHDIDSPLYIKRWLDYGTLSMPFDFKKLKNGGKCGKYCHQEKKYTYKKKQLFKYKRKSKRKRK